MNLQVKPGQTITITIIKPIRRAAAKMTLERLFGLDKKITKAIEARRQNFIPLPRMRGGRIWTKRPNKNHASVAKGASGTIKSSPQILRDLASVAEYVEVKAI